MNVREKFEAWADEQGCDTHLWIPEHPECGYINPRTQDNYIGYLAGVAVGRESMREDAIKDCQSECSDNLTLLYGHE